MNSEREVHAPDRWPKSVREISRIAEEGYRFSNLRMPTKEFPSKIAAEAAA